MAAKPNPFNKALEEAVTEKEAEIAETPSETAINASEGTAEEGEKGTGAEAPEEPVVPEPVATKTAKTTSRRTAAVVEAEAAAERAELLARIEELEARAAGDAASVVALGIVPDEVLYVGEAGGEVRRLTGTKTIVNGEWRATIDGLRVLVARADHQATTQFQIPRHMATSMGELLSAVDLVTD